jgi:hypothetical protein
MLYAPAICLVKSSVNAPVVELNPDAPLNDSRNLADAVVVGATHSPFAFLIVANGTFD